MERIESAAILKDGVVYTGWRHADVMKSMFAQKIRPAGAVQGFVTETGRFVDREIAATMAYIAGQIKTPKQELRSEDLY